MASSFPTSIDNFTDPLATSPLNSPSHSAQHADLNDAVEKIETKLGIGNTVIGGVVSYTPTLTNITLGNGTLTSRYMLINNFVHYEGKIIFGSTTAITGTPEIALPFTAANYFQVAGSIVYADSGTATYMGFPLSVGTTTAILFIQNFATAYGSEVAVSATVPFTWGVNDSITWCFNYQKT